MKKKQSIRVVAAEIERNGAFLITQRRPTAVLPLLWEFPSGKVEPGETDEVALRRELQWRLNADISVGKLSMFIKHEYEDYDLDFCVYRCELLSETLSEHRVHAFRWVSTPELEGYEFPPADAQTIERLLADREQD